MKYILPLIVLVALGAAFRLAHEVKPAAAPAKPGMGTSRTEAAVSLQELPTRAPSEPAKPAVRSIDGKTPSAAKPPPAIPLRELSLGPVQQALVEELLLERKAQIRSLHEGIRRSGVLNIPDFEWQVLQLKAEWYRKIDRLLDGAQHEQFVALVEKGFFNEGLAITIEPGMTVLE